MNADKRLLIKIAQLYYQQNFTQSEIAQKLHLSRQKVQRLLRQARQEGIVQINIRPILDTYTQLEQELESRFDLREALIVEVSDYYDPENVEQEVGSGAGEYLLRAIQPNESIVISWGGTLLGLVNALTARTRSIGLDGIKVIQGLGGLGDPNKEVHASDLTRRLALILGGEAILLPTPGVAGTRETRDAFYADPYVKKVLKQARGATMAIMGIGAPRKDSILIREGKIVNWPELENLSQKGAVGDINLRFFDKKGQPISSSLDQRVIGLSLAEIRKIDQVVGISGGAAKVDAIHGALAGKLIHVLVTDHITAQKILEGE